MRPRLALAALAAALLPAVAAAQAAGQPLARADRWQLKLASGSYLFDVRPTRATPDSLTVARLDTAGSATLGLDQIEELRLVQPSMLRFQTGAPSPFGELVGADDVVFTLAGVDGAERRRIVDEVLRASRTAAAAPATRRRAP